MKKRYYLFICLIALFILGFVLHNPNKEKTSALPEKPAITDKYDPVDEIKPLLSPFDSIVEQNFESSGTVGAAVVITYKGKIALIKCYGVRKEGSADSVDAHTIFRLASVSKSVTGVLASIMDDEGIIKLDDKVVDYLPDFQLKNPEYTKELRVKNLLSQTSGVIPHAYDLMVEDKKPLDEIIPYLKEADVTDAPGKIYTYQNVVYSVYEPIVEAKMHKNFQEIISEKVFQPFGMNDASISFQAFKKNANKAYPHSCVNKRQYRTIPLNDRYYNTAPAAGVNASISDLGNLLAGLSGHHPDIFPPHANQTVFTPQIHTPLKRIYFRSWGNDITDKSYAIGWRIVNYRGHKVAYHGGYVKGYKAEIALCNDEDIGIAILTNSPNNQTSHCIPTFLNMFFDYNTYIAEEANNKEDLTKG